MNKYIKSLILASLLSTVIFAIPTFAADTPYCGNGVTDTEYGEECDDGNFWNRDGCSAYCELEDMTPPEVSSVSIEEGATGVSSLTNRFTITFSEAVDATTINEYTVQLKQYTYEFPINYDLDDSGTTLVITTDEDLFGEAEHAILVKNVKDVAGNQMTNLFSRYFTVGEGIDHTAPTVKAKPEGGNYTVTQSVTLTPYIDERTYSDEYIDEGAKIYYTTTGAIPTKNSNIYSNAFSISNNTTLRYFSVDTKGNTSEIVTQVYNFSCGERANAAEVSSYPSCTIQECLYGFKLTNGVCILSSSSEDDYTVNAATAPLLGSDTPMTVSTKPALYITPQHHGVIPRPIIFKDLIRGTTINFERDTSITTSDGRAFDGYIQPPLSLYSKNYPINFGYTFKSIFEFSPIEDEELTFDPPYEITVPFTERFDETEQVTVFTYNPETEEYTQYRPDWVWVNDMDQEVTIKADKTNVFFVAQEGKNYNAIVFEDTVNHWARNYIEALYRKGIVKGRDQGVYAPNDILTRAEFTKIALAAIGEEVDPYENVESAPFKDVALYAWYVPYIKRAKEIGLINGYPHGEFKPDQAINKAEAIAVLMRAFGFDLYSAGGRDDSYTDVLTDQWYFPAVNFAIKNKLIDGIRLPNDTIMYDSFGPARDITRGEMAKLAIKTMELAEELED
ncbi:S-layer homology domain-containing protein [Patescibacteria group bacterium]|nr:S-layer homology domain-containing protein [Patescibacteria group bacterium]MBU1934735.1 S-layer homology domain-containing protein [Patescibacteria group bacterium]